MQQFQAILVGQAEIKHHYVELCGPQHGLGSAGSRDAVDGQPLGGEAGDNAAGDQIVILAEQYVHGWAR
ncbi:hypothetical protein D3C81_1820430 [compost metagenome]